jgi:hypothetical protein
MDPRKGALLKAPEELAHDGYSVDDAVAAAQEGNRVESGCCRQLLGMVEDVICVSSGRPTRKID